MYQLDSIMNGYVQCLNNIGQGLLEVVERDDSFIMNRLENILKKSKKDGS